MKKQIILGLCIFNSLAAMEQQDILQMGHRYDTVLAPAFLHFLKTNNINTEGIVILNLECSTGALSDKLAQKADRVRGFDQTEIVINFAREKYNRTNLSFEYCRPEQFTSPRLFNLAVIDSCIDYIVNKQEMFQRINDCLPTDNGEIFITASTSDNKQHPRITTALHMIPNIQTMLPYLSEEEISHYIIPQYPSLQELRTMLEETNFEIIKSEPQSCCLPVTEQELIDLYKAIITNLPIFELIPDDSSKEDFITQYIKKYMPKLQKNKDKKLLEPIITTVIHARKKKPIEQYNQQQKRAFLEKIHRLWTVHIQCSS